MNTHFGRSLVIASVVFGAFIFSITLNPVTTVSAEEQTQEVGKKKKQKLSLAKEIQKFTNALVRLTDVLDKDSGSDVSPDDELNGDIPEGIALQAITAVSYEAHCLYDVNSLPWSYTKKPSQWDMSFVYGGTSTPAITQISDLNKDGTPDYLYNKNSTFGAYWQVGNDYFTAVGGTSRTCIYLGTGTGWEKEYECASVFDSTDKKMKYYGDCADLGV